ATLWGAGAVTVVASSSAKRALSQQSGARHFVDLSRDPHEVDRLRGDVVIEVTGSPDALDVATRAAAPGGRVVLLGSTRGVNRAVDFDALVRNRELALVGAHISTLTDERRAPGSTTYTEEATEALSRIAGGELAMD